MPKHISTRDLNRVAASHGFDSDSLRQVLLRFQKLSPNLKKRAISRAIETENWGQLDAFICMRSWMSLGVIQTLPEPLAKIPEVAEIWKTEWKKWWLDGARCGRDRSQYLPPELQSDDARQKWEPEWKAQWLALMQRQIMKLRDTFWLMPEVFKNDPKVQALRVSLWSARCNFMCSWHELNQMPRDVRESMEGYVALRRAGLRKLNSQRQDNWEAFIELDPRLVNDPVVLQGRKAVWLSCFIGRSWTKPLKPEDPFLRDTEVFSAWRDAWLKIYRSGSEGLPTMPPMELQGDKEVALEVWRYCWITSKSARQRIEKLQQGLKAAAGSHEMEAAGETVGHAGCQQPEHPGTWSI